MGHYMIQSDQCLRCCCETGQGVRERAVSVSNNLYRGELGGCVFEAGFKMIKI